VSNQFIRIFTIKFKKIWSREGFMEDEWVRIGLLLAVVVVMIVVLKSPKKGKKGE